MSLLSAADKAEIRAAIKLVTDTFFVTPVIYKRIGNSLDRFSEDRPDRFQPPIALMALVEYPSGSGDWAKELVDGAIDQAHIKVTLNLEDLILLGLVNVINYTHVFVSGSDEFTTQGHTYRVLYAGYDGPLDQKNVLVVIYGELRTSK